MVTAHPKPTNHRFKDIEGQRFGRLVITGYRGWKNVGERRQFMWICRCDCGRKDIAASTMILMSGHKKSCGCLSRELKNASSVLPEHGSYRAMIRRCYDTSHYKWPRYGGRGIIVCEQWQGRNGFQNFIVDMGRRPSAKHSIDRFPNNQGNYEPTNCRWATATE